MTENKQHLTKQTVTAVAHCTLHFPTKGSDRQSSIHSPMTCDVMGEQLPASLTMSNFVICFGHWSIKTTTTFNPSMVNLFFFFFFAKFFVCCFIFFAFTL